MGERIRERRKNGDFIPSNEEMIRRSKYINSSSRTSKEDANINSEKESQIKEEARVQSELDALKRLGLKNSMSNQEMLANKEMLDRLKNDKLARKLAENLIKGEESAIAKTTNPSEEKNLPKKEETPKNETENLNPSYLFPLDDTPKQKSEEEKANPQNNESPKKTFAETIFEEMKEELDSKNNRSQKEEATQNNEQINADQLVYMALLSLWMSIDNSFQKGKIKAIDIIERVKEIDIAGQIKNIPERFKKAPKQKEEDPQKGKTQEEAPQNPEQIDKDQFFSMIISSGMLAINNIIEK